MMTEPIHFDRPVAGVGLAASFAEAWCRDNEGEKIGLIPFRSLIEYPIPTPHSEPHGLVLGPDGAIWFAEEANKIGRLIY